LGTDSLEEAQRRRSYAEQRYWAAVDEARAKKGQEAPPRPLSESEAIALVSRWFRDEDAYRTELDLERTRGLHADIDAYLEELEDYEAEARQAIGEQDVSVVRARAEELVTEAGLMPDRRSATFKGMMLAMLRGRRQLALRQKARVLGDYGFTPTDRLFAEALLQPADQPTRTVADLITAYRADKEAGWTPSTRRAYEPIWRLLRDVLGPTRDVATLTRDDGRRLFEVVKGLPLALNKRTDMKGLSVLDAVEKAKRLSIPTISPKTINGSYMALLSSIFGWAAKEQWLRSNPVAGLAVPDPVDAADKRDPFTLDQLRTIFNTSPWRPRDDAPRGRPLRFWGPLIALHMGMRRAEIAQLQVEDVQVVDGIDVVLVRPSEDGKRIKTKASRRMLPIHPELHRMGFMQFVAAQRSARLRQLFPGEGPNQHGQWGDGFGDWFLRFLASEKITGRKLGMHSFRHNFEDALRAAGLRGTDIGKALAGRSNRGASDSGETYGHGYSAIQLAEAMARISYPGLDLTHLHIGP